MRVFVRACVRVGIISSLPFRNERDSAMSKMAIKFTKEGDLFLGQKIIEVRRVGGSQEVWYKLGTRVLHTHKELGKYVCLFACPLVCLFVCLFL